MIGKVIKLSIEAEAFVEESSVGSIWVAKASKVESTQRGVGQTPEEAFADLVEGFFQKKAPEPTPLRKSASISLLAAEEKLPEEKPSDSIGLVVAEEGLTEALLSDEDLIPDEPKEIKNEQPKKRGRPAGSKNKASA